MRPSARKHTHHAYDRRVFHQSTPRSLTSLIHHGILMKSRREGLLKIFERIRTKQVSTDRAVNIFSDYYKLAKNMNLTVTVVDMKRNTKDPTARKAPHVSLPTTAVFLHGNLLLQVGRNLDKNGPETKQKKKQKYEYYPASTERPRTAHNVYNVARAPHPTVPLLILHGCQRAVKNIDRTSTHHLLSKNSYPPNQQPRG